MATPTPTPEPQAEAVELTPPPSTPTVPEPTYYTVQPGDTLWAIASRFEVTIQVLAEANDLLDPGQLQPGQELVIPSDAGDMVVDEPSPEPARTPESRRVHTVTGGDTLWGIAQHYGTTVKEIASLNDLDPNQLLKLDQQLLIP